MTIEILEEARKDLLDGFHFYELQTIGLGERFLTAMFADIDSLHHNAGIHAKCYGHYRLLNYHFPYAIYYLIENGVVRIRAVVDCRRDPRWIREHLQ